MGVHTIQRGNSRFYVDTATREKVPGVTSVIGMLPKPFLAFWSAKMVAELAVDALPFVEQMAKRDRQGAVDYLKGAARRYTKIRADIGSQAHDLFERMIRGEDVRAVHPDLRSYRDNFADFLAAVNPELVRAEDVAWSDTHGYAGSFDVVLRIWVDAEDNIDPFRLATSTPLLVMTDWKTSKDVHAEVALQLSAYAHADHIIAPDGTREAMPTFDGGAVLHITAEKWAFYPVRIDADVFEYFLTLRKTFDWDREAHKTVIGRALAKSASELETGTQRRGK